MDASLIWIGKFKELIVLSYKMCVIVHAKFLFDSTKCFTSLDQLSYHKFAILSAYVSQDLMLPDSVQFHF